MLKLASKLSTAIMGIVLVAAPMPALASVNPDPASAAAAGIQYLASQQKADGSINGFGGESDWSVEAVEAGGQSAASFAHAGTSLLDFLKADVPGPSTSATALERKIIAVAATGQDSTNFGGVNYVNELASRAVSGQIGDTTLLNDDIFGIIAIDAAHASQLQSMAQGGLNYLLTHQAADGGFSYTTDSCAWCGSDSNDTAAAIIAMYAAEHLGLVDSNLAAAKAGALNYLLSTQNDDGGFGYDGFSPSDGSSTAWSLMALNTIGDSVASQALVARNWLLQNQNADGGFSFGAYDTTDSDTYTTAHAILALLGTSWLLRPAPITLASQPPVSGSGGQQTPSTLGNVTPNTSVSQPATAKKSTGNGRPALLPVVAEIEHSPQVKAATSLAPPENQTAATTIKTVKANHSHRYAVLGGVALVLVAILWFVLESRKSRGANHVG